jgi:hypothetical protein
LDGAIQMSDTVKIIPKRMMNRIVVVIEPFDVEVMFVTSLVVVEIAIQISEAIPSGIDLGQPS